MPASSMSDATPCAGSMPSAWCTSSTPSPIGSAPPSSTCVTSSGGFTTISKPTSASRHLAERQPCGAGSTGSSSAAPGSPTLDRLLVRLHANKPELLMVLDRPEIPLRTNGSERDIRCQVIKRKVSGGTHSLAGRDCRDAFLGLMHTCAKLGIAFWDYLGNRIGVAAQPDLPALPDIILARGQTV